jgi:ribosome biogenesis GTPase
VNEWTGRGRQTTSAASWSPLAAGGAVVDTPGVREFGLFNVPRRELPWLFRELRPVAPRCRFSDCLHDGTPGCAAPEALASGEIEAWRFESYLRLLASAPNVRSWEIAREGQRPGSRPDQPDAADEEHAE